MNTCMMRGVILEMRDLKIKIPDAIPTFRYGNTVVGSFFMFDALYVTKGEARLIPVSNTGLDRNMVYFGYKPQKGRKLHYDKRIKNQFEIWKTSTGHIRSLSAKLLDAIKESKLEIQFYISGTRNADPILVTRNDSIVIGVVKGVIA